MSPLPEPESRVFDGPRGAFHYLHWPATEGAPALHFAHANGFCGRTYRKLLAPLAGTVELFAWDARGHGRTTAPADPAMLSGDWCVHRDDLAAFVEHLGRPLVLAGHSLGAVLSMQLAAERHPLVRGLVLVDPVFLPPAFLAVWRLLKRLGLAYVLPLASRARKRRAAWPDAAAVRGAYEGRGGFATWPDLEMLDDYLADGLRQGPDGAVELACNPAWEAATFAATPHTVWQSLPRVQCPVTVLYGGRSDTFLPTAARKLPRILPAARMVPVPEATHFVPMERPDIVREELLRQARPGP